MTHDKEFYLRLATAYNLLAKQDKHTCLENAYQQVSGEPWPYSYGMDSDYALFAAGLVNALSGSKVKLSPPLPTPCTCPVVLAPATARPPKSAKRGAYTLKPLTENDDSRPYKKGIAIRGEWLYATDTNALAKIRDDRWPQLDGELHSPLSFAQIVAGLPPIIIDAKPPTYEKAIPDREKYEVRLNCDLEKLLATVCGTWQLMRNLNAYIYTFSLRFSPDGEPSAYKARQLYETLHILRLNGTSTVEVCYAPFSQPLSLYGDNGNIGLVMPLENVPDSGVISQPIYIPDFAQVPQKKSKVKTK